MDIAPEIATGLGLLILLIGVALMIFQVEGQLKKWESKNKVLKIIYFFCPKIKPNKTSINTDSGKYPYHNNTVTPIY